MKPKRVWYVFWLFFKMSLCSAISFKRSLRELSIDAAEQRSTVKNYRNTQYSRISYPLVPYPKQVLVPYPKQVLVSYPKQV